LSTSTKQQQTDSGTYEVAIIIYGAFLSTSFLLSTVLAGYRPTPRSAATRLTWTTFLNLLPIVSFTAEELIVALPYWWWFLLSKTKNA